MSSISGNQSMTNLPINSRSQRRFTLDNKKINLKTLIVNPKLRSSGKFSKTALKIPSFPRPPVPEAYEEKTCDVVIKIFSIWGKNTTTISCTEIDVITARGDVIRPTDIVLEPMHIKPKNLSFLVNGEFSLNKDSPVWNMSWPPQKPLAYISIVLTVPDTQNIFGIRFWPYEFNRDTNIKDVEIYLRGRCYFKGEITKDNGYVAMFEDQMISEPSKKVLKDDHGYLLIPSTIAVNIRLQSMYGPSNIIGINMIRVFNEKLEVIPREDFIVDLIDCSPMKKDQYYLFRNHQPNDSIYLSDCFNGLELKKEGFHPALSIRFKDKVFVTCIVILNSATMFGTENTQLKAITVTFGKKIMWNGRMKLRYSDELQEKMSANYIFFTDDKSIQNHIKQIAFPVRPIFYERKETIQDMIDQLSSQRD